MLLDKRLIVYPVFLVAWGSPNATIMHQRLWLLASCLGLKPNQRVEAQRLS
jgi:hypothetical protein